MKILNCKTLIFKELEEVIGLYTTNLEYRNELVKNWGSIWKKQIYTENIEEDKFDFDEETIYDIILQAKRIAYQRN